MRVIESDPDGSVFIETCKHLIKMTREESGNFDNSHDEEQLAEQLNDIAVALWEYINIYNISPYFLGNSVFALEKRGYIKIDNGITFTDLGMEIVNKKRDKK